MIYVYLYGRIGNNLFQIAAAASLAYLNNTEFRAYPLDYWCPEPDNCFLREYLNQFKNNLLRNVNMADNLPAGLIQRSELAHAVFEPITMAINKNTEIVLNGVFGSEKYFVHHVVRDLYKIDEFSLKYIKEKYGRILFSGNSITSILVRRGDYLSIPQYYSICSEPYFNLAIDYIGRNEKYLIISDDIDWCKEHFSGQNYYFVDEEEPLIDLYLQSLCTNNIISNSTFGWWGAWLNENPNKIVVAPQPWYVWLNRHIDMNSFLPEKWILIKNRVHIKYKLIAIKYIFWDYILKLTNRMRRVTRA